MARKVTFHISKQANLVTADIIPLADCFIIYPEKLGGAEHCVSVFRDMFEANDKSPLHVITCRDELINFAGHLIYEGILDYTQVKVKIHDEPGAKPRVFEFDAQGSLLRWE